ncbi:class I SAM-dependent methyltransferase [Actinopolymorpha cephalotaxi]|uniref:SAM-dependent methyltransferase n=2 Tax=Actinopolymorpha cephalotaxi TaxID=504797 RepID=A0ABX2S7K7_9ACTN|nr:class I SAM-dependent methyltransferase [Actinopolymorpha cephalotaxi]NYH85596.1 SAM-dependent methyltransferase [Actinopolymorpha cephalotaxi]
MGGTSGMDSTGWDERYAAVDLVWGAEPNRWLAAEAAGLAPGRALDLAAGEGRNAIWLARRGWDVTAVDFSGVAVERGRRLAGSEPVDIAGRITWKVADVRQEVGPAGAYSLVCVVYLHLVADERRRAVRHAANAVAPGGVLLVVGHDTTNLTEGIGGPQDPRVLFTPDDILADLNAEANGPVADWVVERAERVRRPVRTADGETRDAIDALVRVRRSR